MKHSRIGDCKRKEKDTNECTETEKQKLTNVYRNKEGRIKNSNTLMLKRVGAQMEGGNAKGVDIGRVSISTNTNSTLFQALIERREREQHRYQGPRHQEEPDDTSGAARLPGGPSEADAGAAERPTGLGRDYPEVSGSCIQARGGQPAARPDAGASLCHRRPVDDGCHRCHGAPG